MNEKSKSGKLAGAGILAAVAASLCCITPVLALISGVGGIASSFSFLEPARPYLLGTTVLVLGFAWYQKLKPSRKQSGSETIECACEDDEKPPFIQSKKFLGMVTVFAFLMMAFPYYGHVFYPKLSKDGVVVAADNLQVVTFNVKGMTCASCEEHVQYAVNELPGIVSVDANSDAGTTEVKFDKAKTDLMAIIKAIDETGYKVAEDVTNENPPHGKTGHVCGPNGCN